MLIRTTSWRTGKHGRWLLHSGVGRVERKVLQVAYPKNLLRLFLNLPSKQKIRESEIGEECRQFLGVNFGREVFGGAEILEKQRRKICGKHFAIKIC